jgi:hypothetical protein
VMLAKSCARPSFPSLIASTSESSLSVTFVPGSRVENITRTDEFRMNLGLIIYKPLCSQ